MHKLLDPKNDVVFQKIFGMKKHKEILISFLNSILYLKGEDMIKEVTFEEKKMDVTLIANEKISILDLHVLTESEININVEIQLINQYNMIKRTIFYMSKMILSQLEKGEDYSCLDRTITINILNFNFLNEDDFIKNYGLFEKKTKKELTDLIEIIFIEFSKFKITSKDYNDRLHRWLTFLANPSGVEVEGLMKSDETIKEAMNVLYEIRGDEETVMLAQMREKALMDEQSRLKGAKEEGIKEGEIKGLLSARQEDIIDSLKEIGTLENELISVIKNQTDIGILKYWLKLAMRANSIKEFELGLTE